MDSDPSQIPPMPSEYLEAYIDALLETAQVVELLASQVRPLASSENYVIGDPRIIEAIRLPLDVTLLSDLGELLSVEFDTSVGIDGPDVRAKSRVGLNFAEGIFVILDPQYDGDEPYVQAYRENNAQTTAVTTTDDLSNIMSRVVHPNSDPIFTKYQNIDDPDIIKEICETLDRADFVTREKTYYYHVTDAYEVTVEYLQDKPVHCVITEFRDQDAKPIAFDVQLDEFRDAITMSSLKPSGSDELVMQYEDLIRFQEILDRLKSALSLPVILSDQLE